MSENAMSEIDFGITAEGLKEAAEMFDNICVDLREQFKGDDDYISLGTLEHLAAMIIIASRSDQSRCFAKHRLWSDRIGIYREYNRVNNTDN